MSNEDDLLTKVHIDLPNHWASAGESLWALSLGNDLYEIRNVPFHAYGINWGDIVRAHRDKDSILEVSEVVTPSGNRTLRIVFLEDLPREKQAVLLASLKHLDISFERCDAKYVAIDVQPTADYDNVCDELWKLEQQGILVYETCESRIPGSFDAAPTESE